MEGLTGVAPAQGRLKGDCLTVRHQARILRVVYGFAFRLSCQRASVSMGGAFALNTARYHGGTLRPYRCSLVTHNVYIIADQPVLDNIRAKVLNKPMRIKIIKPHRKYKVGDTVDVSPNEAHGLLDSQVGMLSKDMVATDYTTRDRVRRKRNK